MTASALIELDTTPPAITFADDVVNGSLAFTLTEPAVTAAELLSADPVIPLTILESAIQIPPGHGGATLRIHLRDAVANDATVDHLLAIRLHAVFTNLAITRGALQPTRAVTQGTRDHKARTAGRVTNASRVNATQTDTTRP